MTETELAGPLPSCWNQLFAGPEPLMVPNWRLVRKRGEPFLLLPDQGLEAAAVLDLYPAQQAKARIAKKLIGWMWRLSLPIVGERLSLPISTQAPFVAFLKSLAAPTETALPVFGVLAGNPAGDGQRLLVLLFDANRRPATVVKVGLSSRARQLVVQERSFFMSVPRPANAIPEMRAQLECPELSALALDFFPGRTPAGEQDTAGLASVLSSWVDRQRTVLIRETPVWLRLEQATPADDRLDQLRRRVADGLVHPVIQHGDLTPWNVRISPEGKWTVLDWERGEWVGIPGWDWFHYLVQEWILVARSPVDEIIGAIERLLESSGFKTYSQRARLTGLERWVLLAYLMHQEAVIKPAEGLAQTRELLNTLLARWRGG